MSFVHQIQAYYEGEQRESLAMLIAGVLIIVVAMALRHYSLPQTMARGLVIPLVALGLFCGGAGWFNYLNNGKRLTAKTAQYEVSEKAFLEDEISRMEGIRGWWLPLRLTWTVLLALGVVGIFATDRPYLHGVALGILLFGAAGHVIDAFAYERNEAYTVVLLEQE